MNCAHAHKLIQAELDGELGADQCLSLADHLDDCEACRTIQAQFRDMDAGFEWLAEESEAVPQPASAIIRLPWVGRAAIAAAAAIVLWVAWPFGGPSDHTRFVSSDESKFEFELVGESFDKYLAVEQESIEPNVHIVWLYHNQGFSKKSSSLGRPAEPMHS